MTCSSRCELRPRPQRPTRAKPPAATMYTVNEEEGGEEGGEYGGEEGGEERGEEGEVEGEVEEEEKGEEKGGNDNVQQPV